jgi:hypothetical protein
MMGEKNPNFGIERTDDHCRNMAVSIQQVKMKTRKLTDDVIDAIRLARVGKNETLASIGAKYGLSMRYVSDIAQGKVFKTTEIDDFAKTEARRIASKAKRDNGPVSKEDASQHRAIGLRKNPVTLIMQVITTRWDNPDMTVADLARQFKIKYDQASNYVSGRSKLFESEFPINGVTWAKYKKMMA